MVFYVWDESLAVNIAEIDNEHKRLIKFVDEFYDKLQLGVGSTVVVKTVDELVTYTLTHFQHEEAEMTRIAYAMAEQHREQHIEMIDMVNDLTRDIADGIPLSAIKLSSFLRDWLNNHIFKTDMLLADAIRKFDARKNQ